MPKEISLNDVVTDKVSGFTGRAIGRCEYLYRETDILVAAEKCDDDKEPAIVWFPQSQLDVAAISG